MSEHVLLGHGSGGRLGAELLRDVFLPALGNPILDTLDDQAVLSFGDLRLAFTTDTFVVSPLEFPGGDIGSLAVHGTVNDLAMGGARPVYLSVAFVLEEGLPMDVLRRVVGSLRDAAAAAGVTVVTGDTKVVERGKGDGLFVNTTGIGVVPAGVHLSSTQARPGDRILVSGSLGDHGIAIVCCREALGFETRVRSDSAALHGLVASMLAASDGVRCLRDPTRGGLASALNEIAQRSGVSMSLEEEALPVHDEVRSVCELLGFDPLYVANEGKLVAIVAPAAADSVVRAMRSHPLGAEAQIVGTVEGGRPGHVGVRSVLGVTRTVEMLAGDQLPRIC